VKIKS